MTPNIPEAEVLSGMKISSKEDMEAAAVRISEENHCAVLLKGGHNLNDANDLLADGKNITWFQGKELIIPTHTERDAPFPLRLQPILQKVFLL